MRWTPRLALLTLCWIVLLPAVRGEEVKPLRVGIIGLDTSHVEAFTRILNNPKSQGDLTGIRVVAAYPGGSADLPKLSTGRIPGFTKTLKETYKVEIVDSIEALLPRVDVVLLESVDGRPHLEQVKPVIKAGKPVFIDKPCAGSLADVIQIFDLAREYKVPCFSSSSLRYYTSITALRDNPKLGSVQGCLTYYPCELIQPQFPDLFWYGVHGVEALYAVMGTGCESVTRTHTKDTDMVTGVWKDGRVGSFRGLRGKTRVTGIVAFGTAGVVNESPLKGSYEPLLVEICKFFRTGKPPVSAEETIELFAFMEAAHESSRLGGVPVKLANVLAKAREEIAQEAVRIAACGLAGIVFRLSRKRLAELISHHQREEPIDVATDSPNLPGRDAGRSRQHHHCRDQVLGQGPGRQRHHPRGRGRHPWPRQRSHQWLCRTQGSPGRRPDRPRYPHLRRADQASPDQGQEHPQDVPGRPQGPGRQGHRRHLDRHPQPLAQPDDHLGLPGRSGRLRREAVQP